MGHYSNAFIDYPTWEGLPKSVAVPSASSMRITTGRESAFSFGRDLPSWSGRTNSTAGSAFSLQPGHLMITEGKRTILKRSRSEISIIS